MADRPWLMRTYSGHSSARASNALYRENLEKGQTGLSVAFDLPTQTGYDPDHALARGEVGKVGVPVPHLGEMRVLFDGIPLGTMNTSMTINATAMWLFGMYLALAEERGDDVSQLAGTTQNDIVKEYLARGTYIFGPEPSRRLTVDLVCHAVRHVPRWNPINVCSYHLQEAGATPVEEIAYALATAVGVLDAVRESGQVTEDELPEVVGRLSFFVNSGIRFVEEMCKLRAFGVLWDRITAERYGVTDERLRRFRFGVQVNSLGLTEAQPENNVQRIVLETLGVTLSKDARARAIQLPAWNEALGLPRPWDQQWSLRVQQVLAFETDLLEYDDLFAGSHVVETKTRELVEAADAELAWVLDGGGAFAMIDSMKHRLVQSNADRVRRIEEGEIPVIGVNRFTETADSPLVAGLDEDAHILVVDERAEQEQLERLDRWREERDAEAVSRALDALRSTAASDDNLAPATIDLARAGGTVGEWAGALREVFGEYRAPTGVSGVHASIGPEMERARERVRATERSLGHPIRVLVGKPGLDGHSNGAEQIAVAARDAGMEVIYQGIRLTPEQIAAAARDEDVDLVGLSVLSGSHRRLVPETVRLLREAGVDAPVVVGGIIPDADRAELVAAGVARVYTPKDFRVTEIVGDLAELAGAGQADAAVNDPTVRRGSHWGIATCVTLAVLAVGAGIAAVVLDAPGLAVVAASVGVGAAAVGSFLDVRRTRAEQSLWEARAETRGLRRQLRSLEAPQDEHKSPTGEPTDDWEIDPSTGLIRERHLPVVLQQVIASARRKVQPVSVVFWEVDGLEAAPSAARDQALTALAAVAWHTMRESDAVFRLGDSGALGVLVDSAEPGAVIVADRVRESLRQSPVGDSLTVSAAIACYPSHSLDPVELVSQAGQALEDARARGHARDHVTVAPSSNSDEM